MANKYSFYSYDTTTASNFFSGIWKLTRLMKAAGWTYKASADGSTKDTTGTAANDKWGGNADPTLDSYPTGFSATTGPWIVLQGPNIIKIPITSASSGTFTRGEQISQATSAATGELIGYVFDATAVSGWLVVAPRTGTFDGTHLITGAISSATVTPSATPITYTQEVCFWKNSSAVAQGTIYYICADASGESTSLFSSLATSAAGCTATVAPAGGGTGNTFPTSAIAIIGAGGASTPANWTASTSGSITTHCIIAAVNATPSSGVSADGTFWIVMPTQSSTTPTSTLGLFRLDDTEPGDVNPYIWKATNNQSLSTYSRTSAPSVTSADSWSTLNSTSFVLFNGYIARGVGGTPGTIPDIAMYQRLVIPNIGNGSIPILASNAADITKVWNHPATSKPFTSDNMLIGCDKTGTCQMKGRIRWIRFNGLGAPFDTTDTKTWLCIYGNSGTTNPAIWVGPWDGTTVPGP